MDIINVSFEKPFTVMINGEAIEVVVFKTIEDGNIKFGIKAPRSVKVHREEIYQAIKQKEQLLESE
ncbi:carbon storage regulator [Legionella erythra]|uniref:Carbon storage regulator CsrA n=1 Tax=Legionella erythra TaxID=448 RepID=A0A0W0TLQ7_LEGER|nr:carbon storage regulator [Legionella erythra]KTC96542.1 carbon storage regulator CsrA [Legionella erythra]